MSLFDSLMSLNQRQKPIKRKIAFPYYGGKFEHLNWLLPILETAPKQDQYIEPCGGSGAVLINRKPAAVETFNDLNGEIINFFRVLRDSKDDLIDSVYYTPFSREEYELACYQDPELPALERARRFFILAKQSRDGMGLKANPRNWSPCVERSRKGMAGNISSLQSTIHGLWDIADRLLRVQFENLSAIAVIYKYSLATSLTYIDPPYRPEDRNGSDVYPFEMTIEDHHYLYEAMQNGKGYFALSSYDNSAITMSLPSYRKILAPKSICNISGQHKQEALWVNW